MGRTVIKTSQTTTATILTYFFRTVDPDSLDPDTAFHVNPDPSPDMDSDPVPDHPALDKMKSIICSLFFLGHFPDPQHWMENLQMFQAAKF
jgi:hypothetical protein